MGFEKGEVNEEVLCSESKNAYWLMGFVAADGCILRNGKSVKITQSGKVGEQLLKKVREVFEIENTLSSYQPKGHNDAAVSYELYFTSEKLCNLYEEYGIIENKTLKLTLPEFENETALRCFTRGYFDGDGSLGNYNNGQSEDYPKLSLYGNEGFIKPLNKEIPVKGNVDPHRPSGGTTAQWNGRKAREFGRWLFKDEEVVNSHKADYFWNNIDTWECMFDEDPFEEEKRKARKLLKEGKSPRHFGDDFSASTSTIYSWKSRWDL